MTRISANTIVDTVLRAREAKSPDSEIRDQLTQLGVPATDTATVIECVEQGFRAGTVAMVTGGASATEIHLGENPVFDAAFRRGKAAMRFTSPGWVLLRMVAPWLLLAILIAVVVYFAAT